MGIEFGGGEKPRRPHFQQVDCRPLPTVQYCCQAWEIAQHVEAGSVDEIYSRHFFEHLTFQQGHDTLEAWREILRPGGRVEMWIPDMDFHVRQWISAEDRTWARAGFWGWQRQDDHGDWDIHKSGYDFGDLTALIQQHGFVDCQRLPSRADHLAVEFFKH